MHICLLTPALPNPPFSACHTWHFFFLGGFFWIWRVNLSLITKTISSLIAPGLLSISHWYGMGVLYLVICTWYRKDAMEVSCNIRTIKLPHASCFLAFCQRGSRTVEITVLQTIANKRLIKEKIGIINIAQNSMLLCRVENHFSVKVLSAKYIIKLNILRILNSSFSNHSPSPFSITHILAPSL